MNKFLLIILTISLLTSCNSAKNTRKAIKNIRFLEGTWINNEKDVTFKENWEYKDGKMIGTSILMLPKDTLYFENTSIFENGNKIFYRSTFGKYVIEENKKLALEKSSKHKAIFGNRNKFDTSYIMYKRKGDKLLLEIRDVIDGKIEQDKYFMQRVK